MEPTIKTPSEVRRRALIGIAVSSMIAAAFVAFRSWESARGVRWIGPAEALPFVPFVYYLTELIMGQPVPVLARKWDALAGWQRGVLGTLVAIVAFAVVFIILLALAS
jgi:hypothetical protein